MAERIEVLIPEKEVEAAIDRVADQINRDFEGQDIHLVCILKGSVMFAAALAKRIKSNVTMDFMSCSSYGNAMVSSGVVKIVKDLDESIEGKNVIVVEDIVDTGRTLAYILGLLQDRNPKALKLCTLLDKPSGRVEATKDLVVDYSAMQCPNTFIAGYGLDYEQKYRNLPYIGVVKFED